MISIDRGVSDEASESQSFEVESDSEL